MDIQVEELKDKLDANDLQCLIDVREPHEHEEFNIGGRLIPLNTIPQSLDDLEQFKQGEVIVYCRSGGRSGMAQQILKAQGFTNVRNLVGGMLEWQRKLV